ncbi:hypothetical protein D9615_002512 [Tricholomella constricta]|uniref:Inhibitor I9 domain-containing protein n=1 Tax=Tricholomella constricta TaxID=117010 RepID=A0A8H5HMB1_9AGAR|nr:hypothetical protein D9615_002512 [Tricholomella constricta]
MRTWRQIRRLSTDSYRSPQPSTKRSSTMSQKYIVVFKEGVTPEQINKYAQDVSDNGGNVTNRYDPTFLKGFAAAIPDQFLQSLQSLQGDVIDYIEPDGIVTTQ